MQVAIIDYGAGNLFSIRQAFKRLGREVVLTADEGEIRLASHVIFPGVGHAGSAMNYLQEKGLERVIPTLTQPVLGICLGMQLMCGWNEEGNLQGLGIFDVPVQSLESQFGHLQICQFAKWQTEDFRANYPVPHMGWNDVQLNGKSEAFYFVHSYAAGICKDTWGIAGYPWPFSAALKKDNFYGVQFHPEKSGTAGEQLLTQFLAL
ncbi:imidazole glycerol phosphate synthase subunit HisH [Fluviicola sp.]|uniref:imidazole glycerol phosphate synthase subunit HisH n=1 Tax=Fluviicola sp. TaxID=1917219 RepID=UPI0031CFC0BB